MTRNCYSAFIYFRFTQCVIVGIIPEDTLFEEKENVSFIKK